MKRNIVITPFAKSQIEDIYNVVLDLSKDKATAKNYINGMLDKMEILENHAFVGTELRIYDNILTAYRYLHYKKYFIFYRVDDDKVYIDRIYNDNIDYVKEFT